MSRVVSFTLSTAPPSINQQKAAVVVNGKPRLIKTKPYREWIENSLLELMGQKGFRGDFIWRSDIYFPCNVSKMDVDNAPKAIHDVLVSAGKVPDDRYLADSRVRWSSGDNIVVIITKQEFYKWAKIKKMSAALIRKLTQDTA